MGKTARVSIVGIVMMGLWAGVMMGRAQTGTVLTAVPVGTDTRNGFIFGYGFTLYVPEIKVLALGFYDKDGDGLAVSHDVGLYTSNGFLITGVTVQAGTSATLSNGYRYVFLDQPVLLESRDGTVRYSLAAVQNTDPTGLAESGAYTNHLVVGDFIDNWAWGSTLPTNGWIPGTGDVGRVGRTRYAPNALFTIGPDSIRSMDERSFVIAPVAATASSQYQDRGPLRAINGSGLSNPQAVTNRAVLPTTWPTHSNSYTDTWTTSGGSNIFEWITFEFDQIYQVEGCHVWNVNDSSFTQRGPFCWQISNSVDGVSWQAGPEHVPYVIDQAPGTTNYPGTTLSFSVPVKAKYIKFYRPRVRVWNHCGLSEIRFIGFIPMDHRGTVILIR